MVKVLRFFPAVSFVPIDSARQSLNDQWYKEAALIAAFSFFREGVQQAMSAVLPTYARADVAFTRGEGAYLYSETGERYLDFGAGVAVNVLGHAHPHLVQALTEQAGKVWHTSNHLPHRRARAACRTACRRHLRRQGVLRQFRRGGDGMRDQDGAQISQP